MGIFDGIDTLKSNLDNAIYRSQVERILGESDNHEELKYGSTYFMNVGENDEEPWIMVPKEGGEKGERALKVSRSITKTESALLSSLLRVLRKVDLLSDENPPMIYKENRCIFFWAPCYELENKDADISKYTIQDYSIHDMGYYDIQRSRIVLYSNVITEFCRKMLMEDQINLLEEEVKGLVFLYHYCLFLVHKLPIDGEYRDEALTDGGLLCPITTIYTYAMMSWTIKEACNGNIGINLTQIKFAYHALFKYHSDEAEIGKFFSNPLFADPMLRALKELRKNSYDKYTIDASL